MSTAGKTLNTHFTTPDNCTLGAWFILSDPYYQDLRVKSLESFTAPIEDVVRDALQSQPTILFLHGAGGTRAVSWRVGAYKGFTTRLHANVFAVDYRGFGDSTGSPDSEGLAIDAYTAWNWLIERGAKPEDVVIVGHSLGTGVAGQLMKRLGTEGVAPRGVALWAPFSSFSRLIETYAVLGVPILQPLQTFPLGISRCIIIHELPSTKLCDRASEASSSSRIRYDLLQLPHHDQRFARAGLGSYRMGKPDEGWEGDQVNVRPS